VDPRKRRARWLGLAVVCGTGCTSILGIDLDYTLEETSAAGSGGATAATGTTADGTGVTTGSDATTSSSTTGAGGTSSSSGEGGAGPGGGAGGSGGGAEPTCDDDEQNGQETDVDCGGPTCPDCAFGEGCEGPNDCETAVCELELCGCPEGKIPGVGGCVCKLKHVECGSGAAAPCIQSIRGPMDPVRLLDQDVDVDPDLLFLAANPTSDDGEGIPVTYGVLWHGGEGGGTAGTLARFATDGAMQGTPVDVVPVPALAVGIGLAGTGYHVLAAGTELNEGISLKTSIPGFGESEFDLELTSVGPPDQVKVSSSLSGHAMVELRDGSLDLVLYSSFQLLESLPLAAEGVTAVAIAHKDVGTSLLGIAFVRDGDLLFARYNSLGDALTPIEELEPIDVDELDLTQPLHVTSAGSRWVVGGTTETGGVVLGVLDAAGELVESVPVTASSTELGALGGGDGHVHVVWESTSGQRRPWFTRVLVADEPSVVELPFQELRSSGSGDARVVGSAFLRPGADPAAPELGVLLHVTSAGPEDGVYLGRLAACP
jgi:hypothetical protein